MPEARLARTHDDLLQCIQSPAPTRYRAQGREAGAHVFCAFDALLYALMTAQPVRLDARPPAAAAFVADLDPEAPDQPRLWLTFTEESDVLPPVEGMSSHRCPYLHLFERREDAHRWRERLPPELRRVVSILTIEEAWRAARERVDRLG